MPQTEWGVFLWSLYMKVISCLRHVRKRIATFEGYIGNEGCWWNAAIVMAEGFGENNFDKGRLWISSRNFYQINF